jgi:hypothetical protein
MKVEGDAFILRGISEAFIKIENSYNNIFVTDSGIA